MLDGVFSVRIGEALAHKYQLDESAIRKIMMSKVPAHLRNKAS
jgi:hypothetical protein